MTSFKLLDVFNIHCHSIPEDPYIVEEITLLDVQFVDGIEIVIQADLSFVGDEALFHYPRVFSRPNKKRHILFEEKNHILVKEKNRVINKLLLKYDLPRVDIQECLAS